MFRNPRSDAASKLPEGVPPSTGRPPTPPSHDTGKSPLFASNAPTMNLSSSSIRQNSSPSLPVLGQPPAFKFSSASKKKQNQSILNFFGKSDKGPPDAPESKVEAGLFFDEPSKRSLCVRNPDRRESVTSDTDSLPGDLVDTDDTKRFNETFTPIKRRKVSDGDFNDCFLIQTPSRTSRNIDEANGGGIHQEDTLAISTLARRKPARHRGGFIDESSDEDEEKSFTEAENFANISYSRVSKDPSFVETATTSMVPLKIPDQTRTENLNSNEKDTIDNTGRPIPTLSREATSMPIPADFDENDDFENDEFFEEGEEYMERRWMEEQRELEMGLDEDSKSESDGASIMTPKDDFGEDGNAVQEGTVSTCPLCNGSMNGLTEVQASSHVNACLDGTAEPLPKLDQTTSPATKERSGPSLFLQSDSGTRTSSAKRFQRAAIARPAQSNPFDANKEDKAGGSAFSKLMSGHAEDAAWAEAASNEIQSRGKPAYQRTCPFYKIMPGMYICVDAFRYGKVDGQNAYFLSHFHSDHYIGLTSSWSHGPIYASKVTCNLMRQQLRVNPKWLVPLEFEKKVEVPNTKGVFVTMIPANHCPGSSLYLFEKVISKARDGSPKLNRVLHCGDFRACPAHIAHPLLKPDVVDAITSRTKQQTIDTCYLDTTYLTPKYSFPGQQDVIDACAQMCVSLSKEIQDNNDDWEKAKLDRAGGTMTKFLEQGENNVVKKEDDGEDKKPKIRGRLLVVIGTYSIGKERICLGIAKALNSKIFAPPAKMKICACLEDDELNSRLTSNPYEAQVHMQTLMEIRADTLHEYLVTYRGHFRRVVGFRPTGWSYRPPTSRFTENPAVSIVLHSDGWKSRFTMKDLAPQRGSTKESNCFGVPYSEHSSFRELTMFCCALRINRIIPTVNVGSAKSREKMKGWIEKWEAEKRKNGLYEVQVGDDGWGSGDGGLRHGV